MCGRIALHLSHHSLLQCIGGGITDWINYQLYHPTTNITPTHFVPVIVNRSISLSLLLPNSLSDIGFDLTTTTATTDPTTTCSPLFTNNDNNNSFILFSMKWGLTTNIDYGPYPINARDDSVIMGKPIFAPLRHQRRCVIPVHGFYEWVRHIHSNSTPYFVRSKNNELLWLAGLYTMTKISDKNYLYSFTIITTENTPALSFLHDRMPVILTRTGVQQWLDPSIKKWCSSLANLLVSNDVGLIWYPVDPRVSKAGIHDPSFILPYTRPTSKLEQWIMNGQKIKPKKEKDSNERDINISKKLITVTNIPTTSNNNNDYLSNIKSDQSSNNNVSLILNTLQDDKHDNTSTITYNDYKNKRDPMIDLDTMMTPKNNDTLLSLHSSYIQPSFIDMEGDSIIIDIEYED